MSVFRLNREPIDLTELEAKITELEAKADRAEKEADLRRRGAKARERIKKSGSGRSLLIGWGMGKTMVTLLAFVVIVLLIVNAC